LAQGETPAGEGRERGGSSVRSSLGEWLRTQRVARGVGLDEIVDSTKISLRYLEAIEQDRYDALPAPIFVRGFLREYARVVGLDSDEVVNLYLISKPATMRPDPIPASAAPPPNRSALVGYVIIVGLLLALFVGIAAAISYWYGRDEGAAAEDAPATSTVVPPAAASVEPETTPEAKDAPEVEGASSEDGAGVLASAEVAEPVESVPLAPPGAPEAVALGRPSPREASPTSAEPLRVVLDFQQDCWVEVTVDGRRRASELKAGGETLALEANEYVQLTLGNAPAVRVEVDGRAVSLPLAGSRVVRGLRIDRRGVEPIDPGGSLADSGT